MVALTKVETSPFSHVKISSTFIVKVKHIEWVTKHIKYINCYLNWTVWCTAKTSMKIENYILTVKITGKK